MWSQKTSRLSSFIQSLFEDILRRIVQATINVWWRKTFRLHEELELMDPCITKSADYWELSCHMSQDRTKTTTGPRLFWPPGFTSSHLEFPFRFLMSGAEEYMWLIHIHILYICCHPGTSSRPRWTLAFVHSFSQITHNKYNIITSLNSVSLQKPMCILEYFHLLFLLLLFNIIFIWHIFDRKHV